ncbi:hypothetical protein [Bdellovibrio bacteriovorus]|uniref:hypothetical protein n=1 Tax=Bdellovibrio bacteriovorus TaxID=959 RepID=UPI003AA92453
MKNVRETISSVESEEFNFPPAFEKRDRKMNKLEAEAKLAFIEEHHDQLVQISLATKAMFWRKGEFREARLPLNGVKLSCVYALELGYLEFRNISAEYITVHNKLTHDLIRFELEVQGLKAVANV